MSTTARRMALVLLLAILATRPQPTGLPPARIAAQDAPTPTNSAPPMVTVPPEAAEVPTAEPTATATLEPAPTATLAPVATEAPESTPTPIPPTEEAVPTVEATAESTATQTPAPADGTPIVQIEGSPEAASGASEAPLLTLSIAAEEVSFGRVSATGELDPAIAGLSSMVDDGGASYVLSGAISVTVAAGVPWTGACRAEESSSAASAGSVATGRLEWRLAGTARWIAFSPSEMDPRCFPGPEIGTWTYVYDLRLRVEVGDQPEIVSTVLFFTVSP